MKQKSPSEAKLKWLATTSLDKTWGEGDRVFLGNWCLPFERYSRKNLAKDDIFPFHWDDREKLARDYEYLDDLHKRLLSQLTLALNRVHGVEYSNRYWQILLDPWLLTYIAVVFDRWESLRIAFSECGETLKTLCVEDDNLPTPFSYTDFIRYVLSDEWNYKLLCRIAKSRYQENVVLTNAIEVKGDEGVTSSAYVNRNASLMHRFISFSDGLLERLFSFDRNVIFSNAYFGAPALLRINLALRQVPRVKWHELELPKSLFDSLSHVNRDVFRDPFKFEFQPKNEFESFLIDFIVADLPICVFEGYQQMRELALTLDVKPKVIVTANDHWGNVGAKFWMAEQVSFGAKLLILEHGGSLPARRELFNFEEDISDWRGTWFDAYHEKHIKVPPSKLLHRYSMMITSLQRYFSPKYCMVIGNECSRWVYRAHFYPSSSQCLESTFMIKDFYDKLDGSIQDRLRVKPYRNQGWDTAKLYGELLGSQKVLSQPSLDRVFRLSKVIVCTYPETTFSEAMSTGVPTILLYPEHLYERHEVTASLMDQLRQAKILFFDAEKAAMHLNEVWDVIDEWWYSSEVVSARKAFACHALSEKTDWVKKWVDLLHRMAA